MSTTVGIPTPIGTGIGATTTIITGMGTMDMVMDIMDMDIMVMDTMVMDTMDIITDSRTSAFEPHRPIWEVGTLSIACPVANPPERPASTIPAPSAKSVSSVMATN